MGFTTRIKIYIDPKDEKQFFEDLKEFLDSHAKGCEESIIMDGKEIIQETSNISKAWFYHIEKKTKE